jgi:colanic acid biosynthesis glycosyl transferase WcaI
MRIAFLTQYYPPEMGAPQARLSELAKRIAHRGHSVVILTAMPNYPRGRLYDGYGGFFMREWCDDTQLLRTYVYPTKKVSIAPRLANYFSFVVSSATVGAIALPKIDYLLTESPPLFLGISGYLLSRLRHCQWIFNVSDLWPESAVRLGVVREGWSLALSRQLERFCYKKAWLVTGQSKEIIADIRQRFPETHTYHLSNGVDTTIFHPGLYSDIIRKKFSEQHTCIAIYAGLHGIAQGLDQIIYAAAKLQHLRHLGIALLGEGSEKERLQQLCYSLGVTNVRFLDPCAREMMPAIMASADIALVPLKHDLLGAVPSKLYEAMGAGLPVVLVAQGEATDVVREARAGIVTTPGDTNALVAAISDLATDPEQRARMGANGRQAAVTRFDRRLIADTFIDYLDTCSHSEVYQHVDL